MVLSNGLQELERQTVQPSDFIFRLAISQQLFVCIHWLCHFKIVFGVPLDTEKSTTYEKLAEGSHVSLPTLKSVARMAMIHGFLRETSTGEIQHSELSASFVTVPDYYNWMMYMATQTAPTVANFVKATERWPESEKKNETAYSLSRGTDLSFFEHINVSPDLANEFGLYMKSQAANKAGTRVELLREGFDWASLGNATVVDIGGGGGDASVSLAEQFSDLDFVIQDLPAAIATAKKRASSLPADMQKRLQFREHDFFAPQPIEGAAVYLLRMILHDWPDNECIKILSQISSSMGPDSRIVVMDMVLPRPGMMPLEQEAVLRQKDLVMKQNFNAKERELEEWKALMESVGLQVVAVKTPRGSQHSVLELVKHSVQSKWV
ncbi:hypothetical protein M409DRAFT_64377 [Zasmidium cellare ATCC 36951]|uniref:O-methyltransferase C-terminal domain-containing protein n=1 Tax=Zasmidium cellare ATCC 36951 TaxID=1080233 RepID=A0A6A6CVY9_ZASCE|nr:uncharacterized protein M409DRAFT_64377 [Zasmidium cellare ATCC 36951]KAF2169982.1 hypothetical protein M409DRAFT_64377 [Zasmidium cellare ATCC 36951]